MIVATPNDHDEAVRFQGECERLSRDCPRVVAWIKACVAATVDSTAALEGSALYRECGARRDMQQILDTIAQPPAPTEGKADLGGRQSGW